MHWLKRQPSMSSDVHNWSGSPGKLVVATQPACFIVGALSHGIHVAGGCGLEVRTSSFAFASTALPRTVPFALMDRNLFPCCPPRDSLASRRIPFGPRLWRRPTWRLHPLTSLLRLSALCLTGDSSHELASCNSMGYCSYGTLGVSTASGAERECEDPVAH